MTDLKDETVQGQHQLIGIAAGESSGKFNYNTHPKAQWFDDAGLGLFIHWGISSVHGGVDISWGMMEETPWDPGFKLSPEQYFQLAEQFNPENYDPDKWLKLAAEAGFAYAVLTTRHHDGYALWPSEYGQFSTRTHMEGRDLIKPFIESCRRNNLKAGLYYSPPDWYYNKDYMSFGFKNWADPSQGTALGLLHEPVILPVKPRDWDEQFKLYVRGQVIELLTNYGEIDILWFDGGAEVADAISIEEIRQFQPGILVNSRMHGSGDYITTECGSIQELNSKPTQHWEHCDIWSHNGWGYTKASEQYKSTAWMLSLLSKVRAWGGNLLINVSPRPDGTMPETVFVRFNEVKEWMAHSRQAIHGTKSGDYPGLSSVPVTRRENFLYLHIIPESDGSVALKDIPQPLHARLLRTQADLKFEWTDRCFNLSLPKSMRNDTVDIIELQFAYY